MYIWKDKHQGFAVCVKQLTRGNTGTANEILPPFSNNVPFIPWDLQDKGISVGTKWPRDIIKLKSIFTHKNKKNIVAEAMMYIL
jgi:hypothetical protein